MPLAARPAVVSPPDSHQFAFAAPLAGRPPVVVDLSLSKVARGNLVAARVHPVECGQQLAFGHHHQVGLQLPQAPVAGPHHRVVVCNQNLDHRCGRMADQAGPMLRQMKQLGIEAKMMGGDGICSGELPKLAAGAMADDQVVCAEAGGVEGSAKKSMDDFKAKSAKLASVAEAQLAAMPADQAGVGAAMQAIGGTCGDCHQTYRLKK